MQHGLQKFLKTFYKYIIANLHGSYKNLHDCCGTKTEQI